MIRRMQCATRKKNLNFPEYMFALQFLHATGDNFGKQKQHKMKELSIPSELMKLVLKKSVSAPSNITVNYPHFALVSMETDNL